MTRPRHIMLVAGEPSGDALGAELMTALRAEISDLLVTGVGGTRMEAAGLHSIFPMTDISVMGPREVIPVLPKILRRMRETVAHAIAARPDALVIIDSPDFTHMVAKRVAKRAPGIPIADYVAPSVWAWRQGRARAMSAYIDRVLALLPFEPRFFAARGGPDCVYVGHPAIERLPQPGSGGEFRRRHGLSEDGPILLLLPGSRLNEVKRLIALLGETAARVKSVMPQLRLVIPAVPHVRTLIEQSVARWPDRDVLLIGEEEKLAAFDAATAAVAASGTVALELGLAGVPLVVAYRIDPLAAWTVGRILKVPSVVLTNLILDRPSVREFLQADCTPQALADAVLPLLTDTPQRARALADLAELRSIMGVGGDAPSLRAARAVLEMVERGPTKKAAR